MEKAILSVARRKFTYIYEMDLSSSVKITFGTEGELTLEPEDWLGKEGTKQWRLMDEIRGYMVRTAFTNSILNGSPRKKAFEKVKKQTTRHVVMEEEASEAQQRLKGSPNNIFHYTSLNPLIVWQMYCTQMENTLKGGKAGEEAAKKRMYLPS